MTATEARPLLVVLAGPNGAGKSTYFELYLKQTGVPFVNADVIARALSPEDPIAVSQQAAAAADVERRALVSRRDTFCMETVFSDPVGHKVAFMREAQDAGYRVVLLFIGLSSAELSQARVIERVSDRSLVSLALAAQFVDELRVLDNSDADRPFQLVLRMERGEVVERGGEIPEWLRDVSLGTE